MLNFLTLCHLESKHFVVDFETVIVKLTFTFSTPDDLWSLSPSLTSAYIVPLFQRYWQSSLQTAARFNSLNNLVKLQQFCLANSFEIKVPLFVENLNCW